MKKLSILLLVLVLVCGLFVLTSCGGNDTNTDTNSGSTDTGNLPDEDLQAAYDYIKLTYKTLNVTTTSFEIMKNALIGDKTFAITWSTDNAAVTITETEDGNYYVVNVPALGEAAINYTLKFSVQNEKGEKKAGSFNLTIPAFSVNSHDDYVNAEDGTSLIVQGIVTGVISKTDGNKENSIYVQDLSGMGGYYVYGMEADPKGTISVGQTVEVRGNKKNYNGTFELVSATVTVIDSSINPVAPYDITEALVAAGTLDAKNLTNLNGMLVTIKGVTLLDYVEANGYHNFQLGELKTYIRVSGSSNCITKAECTTLTETFQANFYNAADVTGIMNIYNGNLYLVPSTVNAFTNVVEQEKPADAKVEIALDNTTLPGIIQVAGNTTLPATFSGFSDLTITWELVDGAGVATLNGTTLAVTIPEEAKTVVVKATATCGDYSDTKEYSIVVKPISTITIQEALNIGDLMAHNKYTEELFYVVGTIDSIASDQYGNMYIVDETGSYTIYIYGLYDSTGNVRYDKMNPKPLVKDTIKVLSVIGKYQTTVQLKNAKVVDLTIHPDNEGASTPDEYTEMTIADALNAADGTKIKVTGTVVSIEGAWSEQYGNMNVTIEDANGNKLYLYRLSTKVEIGDVITVKGAMATYNNARQIGAGATATIGGGSDSSDDLPFVAVSPVIGGEYFFAMTQNGTLCYITGEMATGNAKYYMATVSAQANAAKVTILAGPTADTYYITLTVGGATKYMDIVLSADGEHKNAVYADVKPENGFSFDETNKVFYKVIEGENYTFGTGFEKGYTTVGVVKVDASTNAMCQISMVSAHTHEYTDAVTAPTCEEKGYTTHTCACGDVVVDTYVDATGHNYVDDVCSVCGAASHEHNYVAEVTAPTCYAAGYTTYTCDFEGCGKSYTADEVAATGAHVDANNDYKCDNDGCTAAVLPAADITLTIEQALAIGATFAHDTYTTDKYYVTGVITEVYNTTYGNMKISVDGGATILTVYGTYSADGSTRYDAMTVKPIAGETITVYGVIGQYNGTPQLKNGWITEHTAHTCEGGDAATCTAAQKCTVCDKVLVEALGHAFGDDGKCTRCDYDQNVPATEKEYSYEFTSAVFNANGTKELNGVNWTIAGDGGYWGYDSQYGKGQQFGSGNNPYKTLTVTSDSFSNVTKIVINTSGASSIAGSFTVTVGGVQVGSTTTLTKTATEYTFEIPEGATGPIEITYTQTSSKALYIKSIEVTYAE